MQITHINLKNWRNFQSVDVGLKNRMFIIGPNASGKSNLLDVFRFLRDIAKSPGGGLQEAVSKRGGMPKLRCLAARSDPEVGIKVKLQNGEKKLWEYELSFKAEPRGFRRLLVSKEKVLLGKRTIVDRPNENDKKDPERLTQTFLEQINANVEFREISKYFQSTTYLHIVPQLLKYGDQIGGFTLEDDPFGQGFLETVAKVSKGVRDSRLKKIAKVLNKTVPQLKELKFIQDDTTGRPHLEARCDNWRPNAGWQREELFSDGTLRIIGLLWALLSSNSLLLLEEPELSLHQEIIRNIPHLLNQIIKNKKIYPQILISTHSEALLSDKSIDGRTILRLIPSHEGTTIMGPTENEIKMLKSGLSPADVLMPSTKPKGLNQMELFV